MYTCQNCGNKIEKDKKKIHDLQECKEFKGLDPPGEDTVFAIDFFNKLNKRLYEKKKENKKKINDNHNEVENRDLNFFNKDIKEKDNNKVKEDKKY